MDYKKLLNTAYSKINCNCEDKGKCNHTSNPFELEEVFDQIAYLIKYDLKPYELHLGHGDVIDLEDVYFYGVVHEEWQMYPDNSGEYKDCKLYTYSIEKVIKLISDGYAILSSVEDERYNLIMRRHY